MTLGSLAAAIAHEINNPIAAIHGVAEAVNARCQESHCAHFGQGCEPGLILQHTQRIRQVPRHTATVVDQQHIEWARGGDGCRLQGLQPGPRGSIS